MRDQARPVSNSQPKHFIARYVERHNSRLHMAVCRCGWETRWGFLDEMERLIDNHSAAAESHGEMRAADEFILADEGD